MAEYIVKARLSDLFGITNKGELIRCKDCKKHGKPECPVQILFPNDGISHTDDDWYCADGEAKEGESE